jgi:hypothetical protein
MFFASAQTTFYIIGIIFMIYLMVALTGLVIAALVIQSRIKAMKRKAQKRMDYFFSFARKGAGFMDGFRRGMKQRY